MKLKLCAEWIPWMNAYRLYNPLKPWSTIAYEDDLEYAEMWALANDYTGLAIRDVDTMHVELTD